MSETYARIELEGILSYLERVQMGKSNILQGKDVKFEFVDLKKVKNDSTLIKTWIINTTSRGGRYALYVVANNKTFLGSINSDLMFYADEIAQFENSNINDSFDVLRDIVSSKLYKHVKMLPKPIIINDKINFSKIVMITKLSQAKEYLKNYLQKNNGKALNKYDVKKAQEYAQLIEIMGANRNEKIYKQARVLINVLPKNLREYQNYAGCYSEKDIKAIIESAEQLKELGAKNVKYLDDIIKYSNSHLKANNEIEKALQEENAFATYNYQPYKLDDIVVRNNKAYKVTKIKAVLMTKQEVDKAWKMSNIKYSVGLNYNYYGYDVSNTLEGQNALAEEDKKKIVIKNESDKAYDLIHQKFISLKHIASLTNIPYATLRSYVTNSDKLKTVAWIRIHKMAVLYDKIIKNLKEGQSADYLLNLIDFDSSKNVTDLKKAKMLVVNKIIPFSKLAEESAIPYPTIRNFVTSPDKMKNAAWIRIHRLGMVYDQIIANL